MRFTQSVFSLAESVHLIVEISATYRLVSCLLTGTPTSLIELPAILDFKEQHQTVFRAKVCLWLFSPKQCITKQLTELVFCDIQKCKGFGKCHQQRPPQVRLS